MRRRIASTTPFTRPVLPLKRGILRGVGVALLRAANALETLKPDLPAGGMDY